MTLRSERERVKEASDQVDSFVSEKRGACRRISVLGATGSIGRSTLDLIERNEADFEVVALTAQSNTAQLAELAIKHRAKVAVIGDPNCYGELKSLLANTGVEPAAGAEALEDAGYRPADCVVAAIVGAAGIRPTLAAVTQGRRVALANKECLVTAGSVFMDAVAEAGAELLPVDSEHSAALQAIGNARLEDIERITLTASGGPFRTWDIERIKVATLEEALRHPNWSMGPKITIDSATLMNKGLELIEAVHLFGIEPGRIDVLVHPQSAVHGLVAYSDGSVLAQMSAPDMRTPLAHCLWWPMRRQAPSARLDLAALGSLTFERPDPVRFPALRIAREALEAGSWATNILNAANEVAVAAFLAGQIGYLAIARLAEDVLAEAAGRLGGSPVATLDEVLALDAEGRRLAREGIAKGVALQ